VTVRLLGLLEVTGPDGVLRLPGARQRAIIALLALRAPGVVSRPQLVDGLWGTNPPQTAVKTLHSHIARIRRALAAIGLGDILVTREPGYALALTPDCLDLAEFTERVTAGRQALRAGEQAVAVAELRAGLALWHGEPLADCPVEDWGQAEVARLTEAMTGAAEALAEAELALGEHGAAAGELERLVVSHPLRERLWELLIIAHHRGGHPAEALRAYRRARTVLFDDLGVEPGPRLRELETALLAGDTELSLRSPHRSPPPASPSDPAPVQHSAALAAARTSLVGRQRELSEVLAALAASRLVTLTGPGGCGKTRLAVAAMDRLAGAHRVALADLTPVRSPELIADAVATALDVAELPGTDRFDTLVDAVAGRHLVVVLDNCEHLVRHGLPDLVERLRTRCPELVLLATSREALGVAGETTYVVPPLAAPDPDVPRTLAELATYDSVRLFLDRAAEHGRPALDDDARSVATLCAALDGLPLAIELAAARTPVLTPAQIVRRLRNRFGLLNFGARAAAPPHHRALGAALAWSHDLLSADEAALFARLGVFAGGFSVDAAEAVLPSGGILDALTGLVAKSLVRAVRIGTTTRFFMLETIAAYAVDRLAADPVAEAAARERHAAFFFASVVDLTGDRLAELRVEHENLRAAMTWFARAEDAEGELRMATALSRYCRLYGHYREGRAWLGHAIARSEKAGPALRVPALVGSASLALSECDYATADDHATEALAAATSAGNQGQVGRLLVLLGAVARERAEYRTALGHYRAAAAAFDADGDRSGVAYATQLAGATSWQAGDLDAAEAALTVSLASLRERGDRRGVASSLAYLGAVALYRPDHAAARRLLDESLDSFDELEFTEGVAWALNLLGLVEHGDGNHGEAHRLLTTSLGLHRELGDRWRQASVLEALAAVACATGDTDRSARLLRQADDLRATIGTPVPLVERAALAQVRAQLSIPARNPRVAQHGRADRASSGATTADRHYHDSTET
jgi:predicted ATPase/DNA-binding SARP family transcriptional activator